MLKEDGRKKMFVDIGKAVKSLIVKPDFRLRSPGWPLENPPPVAGSKSPSDRA